MVIMFIEILQTLLQSDVNTLSFADGTAEIDDGAIEVIVITSGETLNAVTNLSHIAHQLQYRLTTI